MPRYHYRSCRDITLLARNLRKNQTASEKLLWEVLRRKSFSGYKFLRQHPVFYRIDNEWIEFFIADFYCAKLKLDLELDGEIHEYHSDYDSERDAKLDNKGIQVVRIKNEELEDICMVISKLTKIIKTRIDSLKDNQRTNTPAFIF